MTNDQIESAATDHASKYPEHLRADIVLHYGLGIVMGLKEGSSSVSEDVEKALLGMINDNPQSVMMFMLIEMGKMAVEANAGSIDLKQKSTIEGQRYEIKAHITVKKVKA